VVHLLNEVNGSANRALPEDNPPQREDVLPVMGIQVAVAASSAAGRRIESVHLEPGHQVLPISRTPEWIEVTVPRLDVHAMVVFLEGAGASAQSEGS